MEVTTPSRLSASPDTSDVGGTRMGNDPAGSVVDSYGRVHDTPDREAYRYPVGEQWRSMTWRQAGERISFPGACGASSSHAAAGSSGNAFSR